MAQGDLTKALEMFLTACNLNDKYTWNLYVSNGKGDPVLNFESSGRWMKVDYDENTFPVRQVNSNGDWHEWTCNENGNELTYKNSKGEWREKTYNEAGRELTCKNSDGIFKEYVYTNGVCTETKISDGQINLT
jgi:hypothetical protein